MMDGRTVAIVLVTILAMLGGPAGVAAETCGDADGSGTVSVTDGVQTLRAAAGLGSRCPANRCDVDGSGGVTVSDGVNVLRKAAGVAIAEACPAVSTTESVKAFLGEMTKIARVQAATVAADVARGAATTVDCDEGFFETEGNRTTFHQCRFGTLLIDGALTETTEPGSDPENGRFIKTDVYEGYEVRFLDTGFTFRQDGTSTIDIDTKANRLVQNGTLTIFTNDSVLGQDEYTLTRIDLTTDIQTGVTLSGRLTSALAEAGLAGIESVTLGYTTATVADVDVVFDDGHAEAFTFDLVTNELTPVDAAEVSAGAAAHRPRPLVDDPRAAVDDARAARPG
jgi:hypothetical protein